MRGQIFGRVFGPYLIFISVVLFISALPAPGQGLASVLSMGGMLIFLAFLLKYCLERIEPAIQGRHGLRILLLLLCLAVFSICWAIPRISGSRGILLSGLNTINLLILGALLGGWMTFPLKRPRELFPLCIVAGLADMFSIWAGPTQKFAREIAGFYSGGMTGEVPFVDHILIKAPVPGAPDLLPLFGVSDWIMVVFLTAAANKFRMNDQVADLPRPFAGTAKDRTGGFFPLAYAGLVLCLTLVHVTGAFLPALPFVAASFLMVMAFRYPEIRQLTRKEVLPMAALTAVMIGLMIWIAF